jgi:hypothetical protein
MTAARFWKLVALLALAIGIALFTIMVFATDHAGWVEVLFLLGFLGLGVVVFVWFVRSWDRWVRQVTDQAREEARREGRREAKREEN